MMNLGCSVFISTLKSDSAHSQRNSWLKQKKSWAHLSEFYTGRVLASILSALSDVMKTPPTSSQWWWCKGQRASVSGTIHSCKQNVRKPHVVLPMTHTHTHTHTNCLLWYSNRLLDESCVHFLSQCFSLIHTRTHPPGPAAFFCVPFPPFNRVQLLRTFNNAIYSIQSQYKMNEWICKQGLITSNLVFEVLVCNISTDVYNMTYITIFSLFICVISCEKIVSAYLEKIQPLQHYMDSCLWPPGKCRWHSSSLSARFWSPPSPEGNVPRKVSKFVSE